MIHPRLATLALVWAVMDPATAAPETPAPPARPVEAPAPSSITPRVWIFCGTPGDEEHHVHYEKTLSRFRKVLTKRFGVAPADLTVLYGPTEAGYDGECTRERLLVELGKVVAHTQTPNAAPVWLIFLGHSNAIAGGAFYNLSGPDVSAQDLGGALRDANPATPIVVLATTACSNAFLRPLAGPGRTVVTATSTADAENETEYPNALVEALEAPATDVDHDGFVSVTELFLASHERVQRAYKQKDLMIKEHSLLDGNGDGRGTQRPAAVDATPASQVGLRLITKDGQKFD